ncbi:MAG: ACP S-malonyltransferase [Myxococcota bacterium]
MSSKVAFVFPVQGAQKVGMGKAAYDADETARAVFDGADRALGESLSKLCFEGPEESLALTANTQPAVLTTSVALLRALGETPDVCAGHSLGEYSANVCAGTLSFDDAVRTVRARGEFMQEAVPVGEGAMAAIMKLPPGEIDAICQAIDAPVCAVNYNSPAQTVIAGSAAGVEEANRRIAEAGGRAIPLAVSAPFHSPLMEPAEAALRPRLEGLAFQDPTVPIYVNVDGAAVCSGDEARSALVRQVSRPVRFQQAVEAMIADGVGLFVEIGPGRVLSGLIARIDRGAKRVAVQGPDDFSTAREAIAAARAV